MNNKQVYYNIDTIRNKKCIYNLIFGEKSNRKIISSEIKNNVRKLFRNWKAFYINEKMG